MIAFNNSNSLSFLIRRYRLLQSPLAEMTTRLVEEAEKADSAFQAIDTAFDAGRQAHEGAVRDVLGLMFQREAALIPANDDGDVTGSVDTREISAALLLSAPALAHLPHALKNHQRAQAPGMEGLRRALVGRVTSKWSPSLTAQQTDCAALACLGGYIDADLIVAMLSTSSTSGFRLSPFQKPFTSLLACLGRSYSDGPYYCPLSQAVAGYTKKWIKSSESYAFNGGGSQSWGSDLPSLLNAASILSETSEEITVERILVDSLLSYAAENNVDRSERLHRIITWIREGKNNDLIDSSPLFAVRAFLRTTSALLLESASSRPLWDLLWSEVSVGLISPHKLCDKAKSVLFSAMVSLLARGNILQGLNDVSALAELLARPDGWMWPTFLAWFAKEQQAPVDPASTLSSSESWSELSRISGVVDRSFSAALLALQDGHITTRLINVLSSNVDGMARAWAASQGDPRVYDKSRTQLLSACRESAAALSLLQRLQTVCYHFEISSIGAVVSAAESNWGERSLNQAKTTVEDICAGGYFL